MDTQSTTLHDHLEEWHAAGVDLEGIPTLGLVAVGGEVHHLGCGFIGSRPGGSTPVHCLEDLRTTGPCDGCLVDLGDVSAALGAPAWHVVALEETRRDVTELLAELPTHLSSGDVRGTTCALDLLHSCQRKLARWDHCSLNDALLDHLGHQLTGLRQQLRGMATTLMPELLRRRRAELLAEALAPFPSDLVRGQLVHGFEAALLEPSPRVMVSLQQDRAARATAVGSGRLLEMVLLAQEHPSSTSTQLVLVCDGVLWKTMCTLFTSVPGTRSATLLDDDTDDVITAAALLLDQGGATGAFTTLASALAGARALG